MIVIKLNSSGELPIFGRGEIYPFLGVWLSIFNMRGNYPLYYPYLGNL